MTNKLPALCLAHIVIEPLDATRRLMRCAELDGGCGAAVEVAAMRIPHGARVFPGLIQFYRDHGGCARHEARMAREMEDARARAEQPAQELPPWKVPVPAREEPETPAVAWEAEEMYIRNMMDRTGMTKEAVIAMLESGRITPCAKPRDAMKEAV